MESPLDLPTGTTAALRPEDLHILENEFPHDGTISSVHSPDKAVPWVEAHYGDPILKSMRTAGIGGPIASMLSPDIPALAIFGSFLEKSVVRAAQLLADSSRFMVMLRPITDDPVAKWERGRVTIYGDNHYHYDKELKGTTSRGEDSDDDQSDVGQQTVDSDDGSTAGMDEAHETYATNGVLRLRGGASDEDYSPWLGPVHNFSFTVILRSDTGGEHRVWLDSEIRFKVQTEYTDSIKTDRRPQMVSWTRFSATSDTPAVYADRSYNSSGFLVHGEYVFGISNIPCADFTPPNYTTKATKTKTDQDTFALAVNAGMNTTGTTGYTKNKIEVVKANDRGHWQVTPKCPVYDHTGARWDRDDMEGAPSEAFRSMIFSYQPILDEHGHQYPMKVEFSMGITTMSGVNERTSFIAVNQTHLWIPNEQLLAKGYGVVFNSSSHISDIRTDNRNMVHERATLEKIGPSLRTIPDITRKNLRSDASVSLADGLLNQNDPQKKFGIFRKMTNTLSGIAHRKPIPDHQIPAIRLYEFISRGWDVSHAKWRLPIYPTLGRNFHPLKDTSPTAWKLEVVDAKGMELVDYDYNGTRTVPQNPAPVNTLQVPQAGVAGGSRSSGTATASKSSFIPSQLTSIVSSPATSIGVPAAGPPARQVIADNVTAPEAGPSKSKGKRKAPW
ncbi:hypothetical protein C8J57DRAFT_1385202 [Mycena rebaudengoi]|nr:hypothetical protein C8J57DRAFT_1385202 [Mycena rebaudengoi]